MINHARTLLLNVAGASSHAQYIGEEYIPPTFTPITLPSYLLLPRRVLFGTTPDRYFLNFRAQELMRYLHETELQEFVYRLDARVTYWPPVAAAFFSGGSKISIVRTSGADTTLAVNGRPTALNGAGRSLREYAVSIAASSVTIRLLNETGETTTTPLVVTDGLTQAIDFPGSNLTLKISNPQNGARWEVSAIAQPAPAVTALLPTLELLGEPLFLELFGVAPAEPYATFKNLWLDHANPVYRLGGLVLAMIYRTDELRSRGRVNA